MRSDWQSCIIGDLLETIIDYRGKTPPKSNNGIPTLTAANVKGGRIDLSSVSYVSKEIYDQWTTRGFPESGDVIITTEAPVGEVAPFPSDQTYLITRRVMALRGKKGVLDNDFLLYVLQSPIYKDKLLTKTRGSTVSRVLKTDITGLEIALPSINEQKKIAGVLKTIDNKIALNNHINQTLESMAQAIFKSWFVDFEPVKAKIAAIEEGEDAEGVTCASMRAISGKTDDELDQMQAEQPENYGQLKTTARLFPDAMQNSELGEVPEGWKARTVKNIVTRLTPTKRYTKRQVMPYGRVPVLEQGADIILGYHDDEAGFAASPDKSIFIFGDHTCITYLSCQPFDISQNVIPLEGNKLPTMWVYYAVKDLQSFQEYRRHWSEFSIKPVIVPDKVLSDVFSELATSFYTNKENNINQSAKLSHLRNTLLPKLLSGELSVDAVELAEAEA